MRKKAFGAGEWKVGIWLILSKEHCFRDLINGWEGNEEEEGENGSRQYS